jgi:homoserine kinase type II
MDEVLDAWRIPRPRTVTRARWGINNQTSFVSCPSGEYVLRVYLNQSEPTAARFEHALLARLAELDLSFATPVLVALPSGGTIARDSEGRPSALFERLPGEHIDEPPDDLVRRAGAALAELVDALSRIGDVGVPAPRFDADLAAVHPLVPDIAEIPELDALTRRELARVASEVAPIYAILPRQITHGDFALGNVLFRDGTVSALLDFEFSGDDVRAIDLATACYILTARRHGGESWRPFVDGYTTRLPLDEHEAAALAALVSSHAAVGLIHWVGRFRAGLAPAQSVDAHAARLTEIRQWRLHHGDELVRLVRRS